MFFIHSNLNPNSADEEGKIERYYEAYPTPFLRFCRKAALLSVSRILLSRNKTEELMKLNEDESLMGKLKRLCFCAEDKTPEQMREKLSQKEEKFIDSHQDKLLQARQYFANIGNVTL